MDLSSGIKNSLSSRPFLYGLGAGLSVYALLAGWAFFSGSSGLQVRLASQTIPIERLATGVPQEIPVTGLDDSERDAAMMPPAPAVEPPLQEEPSSTTPSADLSLENMEMRPAPYPGLYETDAQGDLLPIIRAEDGLTPFNAYRKPFALAPGQKLIALVIDDYGLSRTQSLQSARNLPGEVTFLLSPYTADATAMQEAARSNGHEIWLKLPLETQNFPQDDPGSKAILSRAALDQNMNNMRWALARTSGYAGVALYNDLTFTRTKSTLNAVLKAATDRGLGLFDMNISAPSQVSEIAGRYNAPYIRNEIFFHDPKWAGDTDAAAELLETLADSRGSAIGIFKNYPGALEFIEKWTTDLASKGFTLAPLSAIYLSQNSDAHEAQSRPATGGGADASR